MKILVVDDEKLLVKGIKFNLENDGYEVVTGCDGMEAVELAASETPDLIVLDLMMPRLDGLEACTKIREFSQVPIIMLTAKSEDMDKLLGFEHGADDYLTKPFNILVLPSYSSRSQARCEDFYSQPEDDGSYLITDSELLSQELLPLEVSFPYHHNISEVPLKSEPQYV